MKSLNLSRDVTTDIKIEIEGITVSSLQEVTLTLSKYGEEDIQIKYSEGDIALFSNYAIVTIQANTLASSGKYTIRLLFTDEYSTVREFNLRRYNILSVV